MGSLRAAASAAGQERQCPDARRSAGSEMSTKVVATLPLVGLLPHVKTSGKPDPLGNTFRRPMLKCGCAQ